MKQKISFVYAGMSRPLPRIPVEGSYGGDHLSVSRTLCGALIFPSIANLVGRLLFRRVTSNLQRTILVRVESVESLPYIRKCES